MYKKAKTQGNNKNKIKPLQSHKVKDFMEQKGFNHFMKSKEGKHVPEH